VFFSGGVRFGAIHGNWRRLIVYFFFFLFFDTPFQLFFRKFNLPFDLFNPSPASFSAFSYLLV
jgi:hypothetical protein